MEIENESYPEVHKKEDDFPALGDIERETFNTERKRMYLAVRHLLIEHFNFDPGGSTVARSQHFPNGYGDGLASPQDAHKEVQEEKVQYVSVFGRLLMQTYTDPSNGRQKNGTRGTRDEILTDNDEAVTYDLSGDWGNEPIEEVGGIDPGSSFKVQIGPEFRAAVSQAFEHYSQNKTIYDQAFRMLREQSTGKANGAAQLTATVSPKRVAEVANKLVNAGVDPHSAQIQGHVQNAINIALGGVLNVDPSLLNVELPDLDAGASIEIIQDSTLR